MGIYNKSLQIYPIEVDDRTITYTAAAQRVNIPLAEKLPPFIRDQVAHFLGWVVEIIATPTFTTAPTLASQANSVVSQFLYRAEANRVAIDHSFSDIRLMESFENGGKLVFPDPDLTSGSTNTFNWARFASMAPLGFKGSPDDFALPNALLSSSSLEFLTGVLTDFSADTTAMTVRLITTALCIGLDEVRIPPKVERKSWPGSGNKVELGDQSLVTSACLLNSSAHDAITAGDFAQLQVNDRRGNVYNGHHGAKMGRIFNAIMGQGQFGIVQGEPRAATDDNLKIVNPATVTALMSPVAAYQPVIFSPNGQSIDKVEVETPGVVCQWSGTQATGQLVTTRILPRSADEVRDLAAQAFKKMGLKLKGGDFKTNSGRKYLGRRAEYMPWSYQYR